MRPTDPTLYGLPWRQFLATTLAILAAGCAGPNRNSDRPLGALPAAPSDTHATAASKADAPPPALLGATPLLWTDLAPLLSEAAGAEVLEEWCLERLLERDLRLRGEALTPADLDREQALLIDALVREAGAPADQGGELVLEVRRARGLGEHRFASLLRRNAMLRRLVAGQVQISSVDLRQAYEIRFGPRFQTRLLLVATEQAAADALRQLREGPGSPAHFGQVAATVSIDRSRLRGGVIGDISAADPSYPEGIRQVLAKLQAGSISEPVALDQGFAIVMVERVIPASAEAPDLAAASPSLEAEIRLVRERALMEKAAARLLRSSEITVLDPSLAWSWEGRAGARPAGSP
jgi:hypothetical protein